MQKLLNRSVHVPRRTLTINAEYRKNDIGLHNTKNIRNVKHLKVLYVLGFDTNTERRGVYSVSNSHTNDICRDYILAFRVRDEASRFATLLEAIVDYEPTVELVNRSEIDVVCEENNISCLVVDSNTLVLPPENNTQKINLHE
tara:strand:- start:568 stop:996 length:429 start_codon:yes stop_codon:yes gene_type:complete